MVGLNSLRSSWDVSLQSSCRPPRTPSILRTTVWEPLSEMTSEPFQLWHSLMIYPNPPLALLPRGRWTIRWSSRGKNCFRKGLRWKKRNEDKGKWEVRSRCRKEIAHTQIQDRTQRSHSPFQMVYRGNTSSKCLQNPINLKHKRLAWKTVSVFICFLFFNVCF